MKQSKIIYAKLLIGEHAIERTSNIINQRTFYEISIVNEVAFNRFFASMAMA